MNALLLFFIRVVFWGTLLCLCRDVNSVQYTSPMSNISSRFGPPIESSIAAAAIFGCLIIRIIFGLPACIAIAVFLFTQVSFTYEIIKYEVQK